MDSKLLAIIAALTIVTSSYMSLSSQNVSSEFESFKSEFGKEYATAEEEAYRLAIFVSNAAEAKLHNSQNFGSVQGATEFSDLSNDEFAKIYLGYKSEDKQENTRVFESESFVGDVNWVTKGAVQKVKNQGQCGSCWAFSTVASTEGLKFLTDGVLGDFSEQQLVDCSRSYGNMGCLGGLMDNGFKYYVDHGICTEESYPYKGWLSLKCKDTKCTKDSFTIKEFTDVKAKSTSSLKSACDKQPISVAVDASKHWQQYKGGILAAKECGDKLDHGVLLAGYTSEYYLIKNSWGPSWGEKGYIRLAGNSDTCGLANQASFADE